jgi:hypothetical protein
VGGAATAGLLTGRRLRRARGGKSLLDMHATSRPPTALLALAGAFVAGIAVARSLDWIGHGHPKR